MIEQCLFCQAKLSRDLRDTCPIKPLFGELPTRRREQEIACIIIRLVAYHMDGTFMLEGV